MGGNSNFEVPVLNCWCDMKSSCHNWDCVESESQGVCGLERNLDDGHVALSLIHVHEDSHEYKSREGST